MTDIGGAHPPLAMQRSSLALVSTAFLLWLALFAGGLVTCSGNPWIYAVFSLSSLAMLASGAYRQTSYGYLFLVIFLWLGFWLKFTIHTILDIPYGEPVGGFNRSAQSWNEVLIASTMAHMGVLIGWGFYKLAVKRAVVPAGKTAAPSWYPAIRKWLWMLLLLCLLGLSAINSIYGIMQIGLVPRTMLPWPLNALIGWMVSIGLAICVSTLVWWETGNSRNPTGALCVILGEAAISTTTLLSRGVFLFHAVPMLLAFYRTRPELLRSVRQWCFVGTLFALFFGVSFVSVDVLRSYLYPDVRYTTTANQIRLTRLEVLQGAIAREEGVRQAGQPVDDVLSKLRAEQQQLAKPAPAQPSVTERIVVAAPPAPTTNVASLSSRAGEVGIRFMQLAVGRWIGLEGVMSVQAYTEKGASIFLQAATEKREAGGITLYQKVSNSHYRWTDSNVWQFASLPGAAAFLYYSGSMWVVLFGMTLFSVAILIGEYTILRVTGNPLLCALVGLAMSNTVAQFGIAPRQDLPYYLMIAAAILIVWIIQSETFVRILKKLRPTKSDIV